MFNAVIDIFKGCTCQCAGKKHQETFNECMIQVELRMSRPFKALWILNHIPDLKQEITKIRYLKLYKGLVWDYIPII